MAEIKWVFNYEAGDRSVKLENGKHVFYIDDIAPEVITEVVGQWNNGKSVKEIEKWLDKQDGVSFEECESIVESITNWEKTYSISPETVDISGKIASNVPMIEDNIGPALSKEGAEAAKEQQKAVAEATKPKQTRTKATSTNKKLDVNDVKKLLQEKIEMLNVIDSLGCIEIPENLSTRSKLLLSDFVKEQDALKDKYLDRVQEM